MFSSLCHFQRKDFFFLAAGNKELKIETVECKHVVIVHVQGNLRELGVRKKLWRFDVQPKNQPVIGPQILLCFRSTLTLQIQNYIIQQFKKWMTV